LDRERLVKVLAKAGIASRRGAARLIKEGRVRVNGTVVTRLDFKADLRQDHIRVDGKLIKKLEPKIYILLNKPRGVLCTRRDPMGRPVVTDLIKGPKYRLYPVGRLDSDSEGLVVLTTDGDFFHRIVHPRYQKPRTYLVKVKGLPEPEQIKHLRRGIKLDDGPTQPCEVRLLRTMKANSWWQVTVREGRNRLVRRMFQSIHHPVLRLVRVGYGSLTLGGLRPGQYRNLTPEEVASLMQSSKPAGEKPKRRSVVPVRPPTREGAR